MTILSNPRALPDLDFTPTDLAVNVERSNHATSFAGWAVVTMATGIVVQAATLASIGSPPARLFLAGLLLPLLAAGFQVLRLLDRASNAVSGALVTGATAGGMDRLLAGLETRHFWAARAQAWAYGSGLAFLTWSVAVQLLGRGA